VKNRKEEVMYSRRLYLVLTASLFLVLVFCTGNQTEVTTGTLLREMTDLWRLTEYPEPEYRTVQFSSYDRRSTVPGGPGWFSNSDGFGGEPVPNFEQVLTEPDEDGIGEYMIADVKGPGAIVRLWSAAISGEIELFLDGGSEPVYKGKADEFFHSPLAYFPESEPFHSDLLVETLYQRDASYFPIPFSKGMRLVWTGDLETLHFYEVQVRLYAKGTRVRTFAPGDLSEYTEDIKRTVSILSDPDHNLPLLSKEEEVSFDSMIMPGQKKEVLSLKGSKALERFTLKLHADDRDKALRQTVLHIKCDQHPWGQVQSPAGDFFGAAPGVNPYVSLPFSVYPDGQMVCRFPMPFKEECQIILENLGQQAVRAEGSVLPADYDWKQGRSMYFRARWRADHNITASNKDVQDLAFLIAFGKGLYIGTTSYIFNPCPIPTSYGNWWGEGDEKIFVDGEKFPSVFGTGSEDYYNYSWSSPDIFIFPYCGQPRNDGPGNRGFVTNFRWHIMDCLPFKEDIRFFMELYSHEVTPGLSYARIGYHYACPGVTDDHSALMPDDVEELELPEKWKPAARMGARNSVMYPSEEIITDSSRTTETKGGMWSDGRILTWMPQGKGSLKEFAFEITEKGTYRVYVTAGMNPSSGRICFRVDGKEALMPGGERTADLYRPFRTLLRNFRLDDREFSPGVHHLSLVFEGALPEIKEPQVNIDFIWIQMTGE
jgi:hypothetical protein